MSEPEQQLITEEEGLRLTVEVLRSAFALETVDEENETEFVQTMLNHLTLMKFYAVSYQAWVDGDFVAMPYASDEGLELGFRFFEEDMDARWNEPHV